MNALENNGSPKPVFFTDEERLSFTTTLFVHPEFKYEPVNEPVKLAKRETEVYFEIKKNVDLSIDTMTDILGVSRSTVKRAIKGLKDKKYIEREGSDKTGKRLS